VLVFRQLIAQESSTFADLLGDSEWGGRLLIDPIKENCDRDLKYKRRTRPVVRTRERDLV